MPQRVPTGMPAWLPIHSPISSAWLGAADGQQSGIGGCHQHQHHHDIDEAAGLDVCGNLPAEPSLHASPDSSSYYSRSPDTSVLRSCDISRQRCEGQDHSETRQWHGDSLVGDSGVANVNADVEVGGKAQGMLRVYRAEDGNAYNNTDDLFSICDILTYGSEGQVGGCYSKWDKDGDVVAGYSELIDICHILTHGGTGSLRTVIHSGEQV